ncbi:MAG: MBL fold metallo-hydrolase [bacterium]
MKLTFLGTGTSQGVPIIGSTHPVCLSDDERDKRLRVSVLIDWDDKTYLIDCGPDFRQQMLRANPSKIDAIIYTHEHTDHVLGLDDIRPFVYRQGQIPIYAEPRVIKALKQRFDYVFEVENKYFGRPAVVVNEISSAPFDIQDHHIIPIEVSHNGLPILGFRFGNLAYITDAKVIEEKEHEKLQDLDVLVINALRHESHVSHFTLEEALDFIKVINPKRAYLTHISHLLGFHEEVSKTLPSNVFLAYDNLTVNI